MNGALQLSPRELQVVDGMANGLTNKEIAEHVGISFGAVGQYGGRVLRKLKAKSRGHAVAIALRSGIIA